MDTTSALLVYNVVVDYGADPTGGTDATVAINAAIATAAGSSIPTGKDGPGGIVYFPAGEYKVGRHLETGAAISIALMSNVRIIGEAAQNGSGVVLKTCHGSSCTSSTEAHHVPVFNYEHTNHAGAPITGWSIENIAIDFSRCRSGSAPSTYEGDIGINISGCFLYDIQNVSVSYGYLAYNAYQSTYDPPNPLDPDIVRDCYMGTVRKLYSIQCRNGISHQYGTTMIFDSCWVNANQNTAPNSAYWDRGWELKTIYGVTLTACVLEKWKCGQSARLGFHADSCRGLVINGMDVEGNDTNEGNLFEFNNSEVVLNAIRTSGNTIRCANGAISSLVRANSCSLSINGSAFGGLYASNDKAIDGNAGSTAAALYLTASNDVFSAVSVQGSRITPPDDGGSFAGTRTALKDSTSSSSSHGSDSLAILGTSGMVNQIKPWNYTLNVDTQLVDLDQALDVVRAYRVLVNGTERVKLYGTGNSTAHGGRLQLIDGSSIIAGLRIGTAGDPGYALHLTSDSAAKPSTSTWTVTSDERTKENLRPFHVGLDVLRQIVLQTWEYNGLGDTPSGQTASGVIAQDMQPILPDAVVTTRLKHHVGDSDQADYLGVNYHLLFLSALNAVKELDAQVAELRDRLTALENRPT